MIDLGSDDRWGKLGIDEDQSYLDDLAPQPVNAPQPSESLGQRVATMCREKNLTSTELARAAGLEPELVERIITGQTAPSLGSLIKIAKALRTGMASLLSPEADRPYTIVRAGQAASVSRRPGQSYAYEHLALEKGSRHMEPFIVTLPPSDEIEIQTNHDGEEFIYILSGQMEARLGGRIEILRPGDAIYYDSTMPHLVRAAGDEPARILAVLWAD